MTEVFKDCCIMVCRETLVDKNIAERCFSHWTITNNYYFNITGHVLTLMFCALTKFYYKQLARLFLSVAFPALYFKVPVLYKTGYLVKKNSCTWIKRCLDLLTQYDENWLFHSSLKIYHCIFFLLLTCITYNISTYQLKFERKNIPDKYFLRYLSTLLSFKILNWYLCSSWIWDTPIDWLPKFATGLKCLNRHKSKNV